MSRPLVAVCALLLGCTALHLAPDTDQVAALKLGLHGGWNVRQHVRDILEEAGYESADTNDYLTIAELPYRVRAIHGTDGSVYIGVGVGVSLIEWAAGGNSAHHVGAFRTIVHEEMHGAGPASIAAYAGDGIAVEEVTTVLATDDVLTTHGIYSASSSYSEEYRLLSYDRPFVFHSRDDMMTASRFYKQLPAGSVMSADDAVSTFEWLIEGLE